MKLNQYQRSKLNKILIIIAVILIVIAIFATITYIYMKNKKNQEKENYEDTIVGNNYFSVITIDNETQEIKRDGKETSLKEEFGITEGEENALLSSTEEITKYFQNSTIDVEIEDNIISLKNPYQTKTILVEANEIKDNFDAIEEIQIQEGLYLLKYDTQKRTEAAYNFLEFQEGIKKVELDKVSIVKTINDESQTVYGENKEENSENKAHGVSAMGIDNYKKIIQDNGNPAEIVIATIGYGAAIDNTYFNNKITDNYYNFIENKKEIHETIPQGSRTLEVIKESTTDNIKIMPLVVINDEYYTTTASIIQALSYAIQEADVICYEFVHNEDYMISLVLENAFKENVPICCVTKMIVDDEEMFPASNPTTIAVSSVDKSLKTTSYSGSGEYIDFAASSTDIEEIFNTSSSVSKWSGAEYSNAHVVSIIALIKSYNKEFTILEIYNLIRNYCEDLGDKGKDIKYGYGFPNFSKIKISDIDKVSPELKEEDIKIDNEKWEKAKSIQIKATDNIKIYGWNITKSNNAPQEWNKLENNLNILEVTDEIKENGIYYVWVTDSAGNAKFVNFEITKIDNTAPKIEYTIDDSKKDTEKYVTITITATDEESGLHEMAYSWDKQNWGKDSNILKVTENGTYKIYVRDNLENISEKSIKIKNFPEEGTADIDYGQLIKSIKVSDKWEGNTNQQVIITFNDNLNVAEWEITEIDEVPERFRPNQSDEDLDNTTNTIQNNVTPLTNSMQGYTNVTITTVARANIKYYLWIKDMYGNINSQGFTIRKQ